MDDFVKRNDSAKEPKSEWTFPDDLPFESDRAKSDRADGSGSRGDALGMDYSRSDKADADDAGTDRSQIDDADADGSDPDGAGEADSGKKGDEKPGFKPKDKPASSKVIKVSDARRRKQPVSDPERRNTGGKVMRLSRKIRLLLTVAASVCVIGFAAYFLQNNYLKWNHYSVDWSRDINRGSFVGYERFRGSLLKYSRDAAIYLDKEGRELWTVGYEMSNPFATANKDYVAVADKQKNKVIVFDKEGKVAEINTINPISRFVLTQHGVVATIEEDIASTYINFYSREGKQLQVTVKSKMSGNGYPTDLSISPDGKLLMVGFQYIESGKLKGRVVFYNFSDASVGTDNRVIAGFDDEFEDSLIGRVKFVDERNAFAISNHGVRFFRINGIKPTLHKSYDYEEDILSIAYSDKYVAVITNGKLNSDSKTLSVYNPSGSSVFTKKFERNFKHFDIDGDYFFLYTDRDCSIYNQLGTEKFSKTLDFDISIISKTNEMNKFIVTGPSQMKCIQLK